MMSTAEGYSKFVAHLTSKGTSLRELEMMRIRRAAPARQTGLRAYKFEVIPIPQSQRLADRSDRLFCRFVSNARRAVLAFRAALHIRLIGAFFALFADIDNLVFGSRIASDVAKLGRKCNLERLGIRRGELV